MFSPMPWSINAPPEPDVTSNRPMFRGQSEDHLVRRLMLRGWPEDAARAIAAWLCDPKAQPPRWPEIVDVPPER